ncbi:MAG: NFACT family protein [Conexivisphaerales archaeon]
MSPTLELSAFELGTLLVKIDVDLQGYYVNNVYSLGEDNIAIRLHRAEAQDRHLIIASRIGAWITSNKYVVSEVTKFVSDARSLLGRSKFQHCKGIEGERVLDIEFTDSVGIKHLIAEFFGAGNMIITDENYKILCILRKLESKDRKLDLGGNYLMPSRKVPVISLLTKQDISGILKSELPVERALGRGLQLPRYFVEEALFRAGITKGTPAPSLGEEIVEELFKCIKDINQEASRSKTLYLYRISDGNEHILTSIKLMQKEAVQVRSYEDPFVAMDELAFKDVQKQAEDLKYRTAAKDIEHKKRRLESTRQQALSLRNKSTELANLAKEILEGKITDLELRERLQKLGSGISYHEGYWISDGKQIVSTYSLASKIFDESKLSAKAADAAENTAKQMELELQKSETNIIRMKEQVKVAATKREKKWFEKYRWFVTSEGLLAIGGRDATTNSFIIRKHMVSDDLVFHAEVVGSPFFLLKHASEAGEASTLETATATVSFSRAWREGLTNADAYMVHPSQVKLVAPSGMSMPRGSFMIEGPRRYYKALQLSLGIGLANTEDGNVFLCAPTQASIEYCKKVVEILPGYNNTSWLLKRLAKEFEGIKIDRDEILRIIPSGRFATGRILKGKDKPLKMDWT